MPVLSCRMGVFVCRMTNCTGYCIRSLSQLIMATRARLVSNQTHWLATCSTATDTQLGCPDTRSATHPKVAIAARIAPPPALANRMGFGSTESERGLQAR